jgi:hypothetical protein
MKVCSAPKRIGRVTIMCALTVGRSQIAVWPLMFLLSAYPVRGATFVVTNAGSGAGSLRQAVANATASGGGYVVFSNVTGTITLTNELILGNKVEIIGPGSTNLAISGGFVNRVFRNNAGSTSSISGLTIKGGWAVASFLEGPYGGGGVYNGGNLTLSNCVITGNTVIVTVFDQFGGARPVGGGGIDNRGTLTLESSLVSSNTARGPSSSDGGPGFGGGIFNGGFLLINKSSILGNSAVGLTGISAGSSPPAASGGGIYSVGTVVVVRSTISGNLCGQGQDADGNGGDGGSGGGVYNTSVATFRDCTINGNRAGNGGSGGGAFVFPPFPGGKGGSGGGIYNSGTARLTNCTVHGNITGAGGHGGNDFSGAFPPRAGSGGNGGNGAGIYSGGTLSVVSCTISAGSTGAGGSGGFGPSPGNAGNAGSGGGIWKEVGAIELLNTIIANNTATGGAPDVAGFFFSQGHNLIGNTSGSAIIPLSSDLLNTNAQLGPLANNGGPTFTCALLSDSPAINTGTGSGTPAFDQRGTSRPQGGLVDIGAFEALGGFFAVTNAANAGAGSLRQAIANATAFGGGYVVFSNVTGTITVTNELILGNKVEIIGPGPTNLAISGGFVSRVFRNNTGSTSSISGLTIKNGWGVASVLDGPYGGGGIYNGGNLTLSNCVFTGNTALVAVSGYFGDAIPAGGGGIDNRGILTLESSLVSANTAHGPFFLGTGGPGFGGGIFNGGSLLINNSSVSGNSALGLFGISAGSGPPPAAGGGIYSTGTLVVVRSTISGNLCGAGQDADGNGGNGGSGAGVYNTSVATFRDCTINGNRAGDGGSGGSAGPFPPWTGGNGGSGGGIYNSGAVRLTNCTVHGNITGAGGHGGNNSDTSARFPKGGTGGNGGYGAGIYNGGTLLVASCTISAGVTGSGGLGGFAFSPNLPGDSGSGGSGGGIWNQSGSAGLLNTIIANNTTAGSAPDAGGIFVSQGHNLIGTTNGNQGLAELSDIVNASPLVGPLTDNGGPTFTCALLPGSPAIDAGRSGGVPAFDQRGIPKDLTVDIGAFESFRLRVRVFLQGPYRTDLHIMPVSNPANLPLISPYASDPRPVSPLPSNVVDWLLVELVAVDGGSTLSRSAFLNAQGQLLSPDGSQGITADIFPGSYSIVFRHRNHLAVMSAQPLPFTNSLITYDFTTGAEKFSGGTNASVKLETGVWGMTAGDADGDGKILAVDRSIHTNQLGRVGYHRADFNLDGIVSINDLALWTTTQGRTTAVTNRETLLSGGLTISPVRKTLLPGDSQFFTITGTTGVVIWAMAENSSGATLTSLTATSAVYQAGSFSNAVDIVEAWEGNQLGRAWANVIGADEVARAGKSILITGRRSADDPLWPTTDYLGGRAYNTLLYRGFAKHNIQYLSPVTDQDVDGNGVPDDVALTSSFNNAASTFTNWAMVNPDRLFIYLVDHGGTSSGVGYFRLNPAEVLIASNLNVWLDTIQARYSNDVIVVLDFCEAGSFVEPLKYSGPGKRTVISACATNEPTYFLAGGLVSFSDAFFGGLVTGFDVADAFSLARDAMLPYQSAWLDANGDGIYAAGVDPALVAGTYVGPSFIAGQDIPQIGHVMENQTLFGGTEAALRAYDIVSDYPLDQVWCLVVPPGHDPNPANPVADLPSLDLAFNPDTRRYEAQYSGFSEVGIYKLIYYARDIWDSVSLPRQSYVNQAGFQEKIILLAGGNTNDTARWTGIDNMARLAYNTFRSRRLNSQAIYYLSPLTFEDVDHDGTNDVAAVSSITNLSYAITDWANGANKLTVYLLGDGANGLFRLNSAETLAPANLKTWLDAYQASNGEAQVVMDFSGSGGFIPGLRPLSPNLVRICVASAQPNQPCLFGNGGQISFCQFFLSHVFSGFTIRQAFDGARDAIRLASGDVKQTAQMDDNGDGLANKLDGAVAGTRYIGAAFRTGADVPVIGSVMSNSVVVVGNSLVLWARDVTDVDGISNVWCIITPPDYKGVDDLPKIDLAWNTNTSRYEVLATNFTRPGKWVCTFFAQDNTGLWSSPMQSEVTVTDAYETDDSSILATIFSLGEIQQHNLHSSADEDWIRFYAPTGYIFNVTARQRGTNSDLQLQLYYEQPDGSLELIDFVDNYGTGSNITESLTLDLKTGQSGKRPGLYSVRVSSYDTNLFGPGSEYELQIYVPIGGAGGVPFPPLSPWLPTLSVGSFYVFVGPQPLAVGAGWRITQVTNEIYFSGAPIIYSLPASPNYTLSFRDIPGYRAPTNHSLVITADQVTSVMAYYTYTNLSPRAYRPVINPGAPFQLTFLAHAGKRYAIEESTNLLHWMPLLTNQVPPDGLLHLTRTNSTATKGVFYRARLVP